MDDNPSEARFNGFIALRFIAWVGGKGNLIVIRHFVETRFIATNNFFGVQPCTNRCKKPPLLIKEEGAFV